MPCEFSYTAEVLIHFGALILSFAVFIVKFNQVSRVFLHICQTDFVRRKKNPLTNNVKAGLETLDTISNWQTPVFSLGVSQHMHKIMNLWKFEPNWSSELRDNCERKKHPCHTKLGAFRCLILRTQILNLRSQNQIHGKLPLPRKLRHFKGSRFSQCTINLSPLLVTK